MDSIHELGTILDETYRAKDDNTDTASDRPLPTAAKLVSALKGSREKEGWPLKKCSVSWASDVYDPPPTSVSHYPKKKSHQKIRSNKIHGKGKRKSKKRYHKISTYSNTERVMAANDYLSPSKLLDFTVERHDGIKCPESNCGSSYRGKVESTLHFPYAEAT